MTAASTLPLRPNARSAGICWDRRLVRRGFERFRFSKSGKTAEREEAWVEIEPHDDIEIDEQRGYDALFAAHPEWGTGDPVKAGIGWSSALSISSPNVEYSD